MDGNAARGAGSDAGEEGINLSRNAAIVCGRSRKQRIGLAEADLVALERLEPIRQECGELIAIFVTIPKRSKENLS